MKLTARQKRVLAYRSLQFDRGWVANRSDVELRACVASAAAGNHDGARFWWYPIIGKDGEPIPSLAISLQALAEEVMRRVSYPAGSKLPAVDATWRL